MGPGLSVSLDQEPHFWESGTQDRPSWSAGDGIQSCSSLLLKAGIPAARFFLCVAARRISLNGLPFGEKGCENGYHISLETA